MPRADKQSEITSELVRILAERRVALGLSKNALAQRAGLTIGAIRFIEDRKRRPSLDTVLRISNALGVPLWKALRAASLAVEEK